MTSASDGKGVSFLLRVIVGSGVPEPVELKLFSGVLSDGRPFIAIILAAEPVIRTEDLPFPSAQPGEPFVDVTALAHAAGVGPSVTVSLAAWQVCVAPLPGEQPQGSEVKMRLFNLLAYFGRILRAEPAQERHLVLCVLSDDQRRAYDPEDAVPFVLVQGADSSGRSTLLIILAHEDDQAGQA
ncbi:uncharacterized protein CMC5_024120 [Chondromyces crocatus]|uniref:Uncharacterized protein n=2 Tax=Chondromyces crocatus TaxID=52 RepID=A0A0K1EBP1_CHOCO|nr:uncharacterized protein CMC5_024120 [Chondromyces crocatus]